jgi:hypothetical protein
MKDFDDEICEDRNELIVKGDEHTATILDAETDLIKCSFNGSNDVQLDTSKYKYITLTYENLHVLLGLIDESECIINDKKIEL